jgi:NAD dependent epimerase/dehydratase family enzyme
MLGCSIFDAGKHPVGVLEATQNGAQTTVWISFGEGRGTLAWMHLDPDDLP